VVLDDAWGTVRYVPSGPSEVVDRALAAHALAMREVEHARKELLGYEEATLQLEAGTRLNGLLGALAEAIGRG
jgi:hypothetical protein